MVKYSCEFRFDNFHVGKIILCFDIECEAFILYAHFADKTDVLSKISIPTDAGYFFAMQLMKLFDHREFEAHKNITHAGVILGGAFLAIIDSTCIICETSADYGPIDMELLKKCIPETYRIVGESLP